MTGESITYEEMHSNVLAYASGFAKLGFKEGDIVMIAMTNSILFPLVTLALNHIGVTAAPVNPLYTPYEMSKFLKLTNAKAIIAQPIFLPNLTMALDEVSELQTQIFCDGPADGKLSLLIPNINYINNALSIS
jgi:acyl-coenzyme A synthetase/AMP-(fatty) acid ligase